MENFRYDSASLHDLLIKKAGFVLVNRNGTHHKYVWEEGLLQLNVKEAYYGGVSDGVGKRIVRAVLLSRYIIGASPEVERFVSEIKREQKLDSYLIKVLESQKNSLETDISIYSQNTDNINAQRVSVDKTIEEIKKLTREYHQRTGNPEGAEFVTGELDKVLDRQRSLIEHNQKVHGARRPPEAGKAQHNHALGLSQEH